MWIVASAMPAAPPSSRSVISVLKPFDSAHIRYMRRSISAQSQASVPPAPAWMVRKTLQWSLGPPSIDRSSNASKSASACFDRVADLVVELVGLRLLGQLDRRREVVGLLDQLLEWLEHRVERLQLLDDRLGLLLVVPEGRALHLTARAHRGGLALSPKSKRVS